ncbi:pf09347 domain protein [Diplodia corticola]|uniref:Pf09347 domain protein n=1 Tax=Diplodia corticola TaxID=236234 RepID=A0A1J9RAY6_9PEZI|nr:pf09347 domain protein [Diplodia corticola]OJD29587.1 pf09347 domain protein [Diplodia corticola]
MIEPPAQVIPARRGAATLIRRGQRIKVINTSGTQVVDTWAFALHTAATASSGSPPDAPLFPAATASSLTSYSSPANFAASVPEYTSMSHTRASLGKTHPAVGDALYSQKRAPIMTIVEDTSPGVHDTLIAACDRWRYAELGIEGYHESCTDNFWDALDALLSASSSSAEAGGGLGPSLSPEQREGLRQLQARLGGRVPDPFNLFMNIPTAGTAYVKDLSFEHPVTKPGDYVVLRAERDAVVVMSACPQEVLDINGRRPSDAHFQVLDE